MNKSSKAADAVKEIYDKHLKRPVVTRWHWKYESVKRLDGLSQNLESLLM